MTITEFLLARITEDLQQAEDYWTGGHDGDDGPGTWLGWVKAECEAKRQIVDAAESFGTWEGSLGETVLLALASIYADHPDYREEWRV